MDKIKKKLITLKDIVKEHLIINEFFPNKNMPKYLFITLPKWLTIKSNRGLKTYINDLGYNYYYLFNDVLLITQEKIIDYNKD